MKILHKILLFVIIIPCIASCKKYLDTKPDKKQVIPLSLQDCQALLNHVSLLSTACPRSGELSTDDYTLTFSVWDALASADKEPYIWQSDANIIVSDWSRPYENILVANQVLETLTSIMPSASEQSEWNRIKGSALLLRGMTFYSLSQIFTKPYDPTTANQDLGIPLPLSPSLSEKVERGNLQKTYDRIISDLNEASKLLPPVRPNEPATRSISMPVKAAALAALARVHLTMGQFADAFNSADACLKQYSELIDYNSLNPAANNPILSFNTEVLYHLSAVGLVPLSRGRVAKSLYDSYLEGDQRKRVCFRLREPNTYTYKGTYAIGAIFMGLAVNEVFLIRAECAARAGDTEMALADLNTLIKMRWNNTFVPFTAPNANEALELVLAERRKELPFRGLRWTDLRRLNKEGRLTTTLTRELNGQTYTLPPNDPRYTLLIPREILQRESFPQNLR